MIDINRHSACLPPSPTRQNLLVYVVRAPLVILVNHQIFETAITPEFDCVGADNVIAIVSVFKPSPTSKSVILVRIQSNLWQGAGMSRSEYLRDLVAFMTTIVITLNRSIVLGGPVFHFRVATGIEADSRSHAGNGIGPLGSFFPESFNLGNVAILEGVASLDSLHSVTLSDRSFGLTRMERCGC